MKVCRDDFDQRCDDYGLLDYRWLNLSNVVGVLKLYKEAEMLKFVVKNSSDQDNNIFNQTMASYFLEIARLRDAILQARKPSTFMNFTSNFSEFFLSDKIFDKSKFFDSFGVSYCEEFKSSANLNFNAQSDQQKFQDFCQKRLLGIAQTLFPEGVKNEDKISDEVLDETYSDYKNSMNAKLTFLIKTDLVNQGKDLKGGDLLTRAVINLFKANDGLSVLKILLGPGALKWCLVYEQEARSRNYNQNQIWALRKMAIFVRIVMGLRYDDLLTMAFAGYYNDNIRDFASSTQQFREINFSRTGEDDDLENWIRNDSVEEFIAWHNRSNSSLRDLNFNGLTAFEFVSLFGSIQILKYILRNGYRPTQEEFQNAFVRVVISGNAEGVHFFEGQAANFDIDLSPTYRLAYFVAKCVGHENIAKYIYNNLFETEDQSKLNKINIGSFWANVTTQQRVLDSRTPFINLRTVLPEESDICPEDGFSDSLFETSQKWFVSLEFVKELSRNPKIKEKVKNGFFVKENNASGCYWMKGDPWKKHEINEGKGTVSFKEEAKTDKED